MIKEKNINKIKKIYLINAITLIIAYGLLWRDRFALDTYINYYEMDSYIFLKLGRPINYMIATFLNSMKINATINYKIFLLILFLVLSSFMTYITIVINNNGNFEKKYDIYVLNLIVQLSFINIFFLEFQLYRESYSSSIIKIVFLWISLHNLFKENLVGYILSFIFLNMAMGFIFLNMAMGVYQIVLVTFTIISIEYFLIKYSFKKESMKSIYISICIGFTTSVINIISIKILQNVFNIEKPSRNIEISNLFDNFYHILKKFLNDILILGYGYYSKYFLLIIFMIIIILWIYSLLKNKKSIIIASISSMILFATIFAPHLFTNTIWMVPRTMTGFPEFISAILLFIFLFNKENFKMIKFISAISLIFIIINIILIQNIISDQITTNALDKYTVHQVKEKIIDYENDTGIKVKNICIIQDTNRTYGYYDYVNNIYGDTNIRAFSIPWSNYEMFNLYSGLNLQKKEYDNSTYNKNYDTLNLEKQIWFEEDTIYLISY